MYDCNDNVCLNLKDGTSKTLIVGNINIDLSLLKPFKLDDDDPSFR